MSVGSRIFHFSKAIVREIPDTLADQALRMNEPSSPVDLERARLQHSHYVSRIRQLVPEVLVLPADNSQPDCVFVDDPAVVCNDVALICRMGHESRRGEAAVLKKALETFGLRTVEMTQPARMDGGDVLFTGREYFVGLSSRTNEVSTVDVMVNDGRGLDYSEILFPFRWSKEGRTEFSWIVDSLYTHCLRSIGEMH